MKTVEERLASLEQYASDFKDGLDVLADIVNSQQVIVQRHLVELTDHFAESLEPNIAEIVRKTLVGYEKHRIRLEKEALEKQDL